ncbi:signal peptidase I [Geodermatophilus sp. FMUSA9-8]|uniref:signal peptidase I n=1 Tax=Geodermatophilus sp. FMUSA9-8 TaxID=3120155 RepID=UPI00300887AE
MADGRPLLTHREPAPSLRRRSRAGRVTSALAALLCALVAASVAGLLPLQLMRVDSDSMRPTLAAGDLVLVDHDTGPVRRMDVVAVRSPVTGGLLVKRVVGTAGDRVALEDGWLVVDGQRVCEAGVDHSRLDGVFFGPVTVPAGELFLLGDARGSSVDSRTFGTVPATDVVGAVLARVWPAPGPLHEHGC